MTKTTKTALLSQVAELTKTIENLQVVTPPTHRVLSRNVEVPIQSAYLAAVDLAHVDHMREVLRRRAANELADELIRSGAVQIKETMFRDVYRAYDVLRLEASVKVAA
jgi:hemoglobin-like flavoprotein